MKALLATWLLMAAAVAPTPPVSFLIDSTVADFQTHGAPGPIHFQQVRLGHVSASEGAEQYFPCGDFARVSSTKAPDWAPFITIKTSGHETWLGERAAGLCARPSIEWEATGDLTASLQARFDGGVQP